MAFKMKAPYPMAISPDAMDRVAGAKKAEVSAQTQGSLGLSLIHI